jgi:hypothetical protein
MSRLSCPASYSQQPIYSGSASEAVTKLSGTGTFSVDFDREHDLDSFGIGYARNPWRADRALTALTSLPGPVVAWGAGGGRRQ